MIIQKIIFLSKIMLPDFKFNSLFLNQNICCGYLKYCLGPREKVLLGTYI